MSRRLDTLFTRRIIRRPTTNRLRKRTFFVGRLYIFVALLSNANEFGHTSDWMVVLPKTLNKEIYVIVLHVCVVTVPVIVRTPTQGFENEKTRRLIFRATQKYKKNKRVVREGVRNRCNYLFLAEN